MNTKENARVMAGAQASSIVNANYTPAERLLQRLERVKETGPGRWVACCPAHLDRNPSLSIRETEDGTLLLKCWPGCSVGEIVAAVGLHLSDLFPPRPEYHHKGPTRRRWSAAEALRCLATEAAVISLAAGDIADSETLSPEDTERVHLAARRIAEAREVVA